MAMKAMGSIDFLNLKGKAHLLTNWKTLNRVYFLS